MRKRNRIFRAVLAISLCINLVACMPPTTSSGNEEKKEHVHSFETEWSTNYQGHWHACKRCHEKVDFVEHSGGNASCGERNRCEVCDKEYGGKVGHTYGGYTQTEDGGIQNLYIYYCGNPFGD